MKYSPGYGKAEPRDVCSQIHIWANVYMFIFPLCEMSEVLTGHILAAPGNFVLKPDTNQWAASVLECYLC